MRIFLLIMIFILLISFYNCYQAPLIKSQTTAKIDTSDLRKDLIGKWKMVLDERSKDFCIYEFKTNHKLYISMTAKGKPYKFIWKWHTYKHKKYKYLIIDSSEDGVVIFRYVINNDGQLVIITSQYALFFNKI